MVKAQEKVLLTEMVTRYEEVAGEWLEIEGCPIKIPETLEELEQARSPEESKARKDWVKGLLWNKSERSDGWIRYVYENFQDIVALDLEIAERSRFGEFLATRLACMFEVYVERSIFEEIEGRLNFEREMHEQMNSLFDDLAQLAMAYPAGAASEESESLSDSEHEDDLDLY